MKRLNRHGVARGLVLKSTKERIQSAASGVITRRILKQPLRHWYLMGYVTFILLVLLHNMIVEIRHDNCALLFLLNGTAGDGRRSESSEARRSQAK
jgi:hypothetical protein